jgi:deoxyribonuclease-4
MNRLYGVHTSISKSLSNAIEEARLLGCTTFQIFLQSPRTWSQRKILEEEIASFKSAAKESGYDFYVVHCSYLINLFSLSAEVVKKSLELFAFELNFANLLGATYYVLHLRENKVEPFAKQLEKLISFLGSLAYEGNCKVLIENPAGGESLANISVLRDVFFELKHRFDFFSGLCIDTAHLYAAGYELSAEGYQKLLAELSGVENEVKLIHLNDCASKFGSGRDQHASLGDGYIGLEGLQKFLLLENFKTLPVILETPRKTLEDDLKNLLTLKKLIFGAC